MIKIYEVRNLLFDNEPILKNVTGCDIYWKEGRRLMYRDVKKKQKSNSGGRRGVRKTPAKRGKKKWKNDSPVNEIKFT